MSKYRVTVSATCNMVGADWKETIDLLDYLSEDKAKDAMKILEAGGEVDELEEDMRTLAIQISGYEWNYYPASNDDEDDA